MDKFFKKRLVDKEGLFIEIMEWKLFEIHDSMKSELLC